MASHKLMLEARDTLNTCILPIEDVSVYNTDVDVNCPILQITLPGFEYSVVLREDDGIDTGFNVKLTACDLEIQTANCGSVFSGLPDGIYVIKYSVSPNDAVYVEYNHLRITKALNKYNEILCDIDVSVCDPPADIQKKLRKLWDIKMYLEIAKATVEICLEPRKGMELYKYAVKQLDKMNCKSCHNQNQQYG